MVRDLGADERVELRPPGPQHLVAQVFTPRHRRRLQNLKSEVRVGGRRDGWQRAVLSVRPRLTEPGQIQAGEVACIGERGWQAGLKLGRRQVQKTACRAFAECRMSPSAGRTVERNAVLTDRLFERGDVPVATERVQTA